MNPRYTDLSDIREKLRPLLGEDAEGVMFEVEDEFIFVNWPQSELLEGPERAQVKQVVKDNLPPRYRSLKVSIT